MKSGRWFWFALTVASVMLAAAIATAGVNVHVDVVDAGTTIVVTSDETSEAPPSACDDESVVRDAMTGSGWLLDGYLTGHDIIAFVELTGPLPDGFTPADFKSVQVWGVEGSGQAVLFAADDGCARFVVTGPRPGYQEFLTDLRAAGASAE